MLLRTCLTALVMSVVLVLGSANAGTIGLKLSGDGVVNDSTIKAGQPVSVDIYVENDSLFSGFTFGFAVTSPDSSVKAIVHVADSGNGLNKNGDVKGFNGWQDHSIWNFGGVYTVDVDWDGEMPELVGFGGISVNQEYQPHPYQKVLSFQIMVPEPGLIKVDSSFFPPGGAWIFATPVPEAFQEPKWNGPLVVRAVK